MTAFQSNQPLFISKDLAVLFDLNVQATKMQQGHSVITVKETRAEQR